MKKPLRVTFPRGLPRRRLVWAEAFEKLLETEGVERGRGSSQGDLSATVAECSKELGVPEQSIFLVSVVHSMLLFLFHLDRSQFSDH